MSGYQTGKENQLTSDGIYTDTYDANGNLTKQVRISDGQATDYTFDYRNRMTEAVVKTSTGTVLEDEKLTYDVNNDRIGVMLNGVQQLWTVYDRGHPYLDFNGSGQLTQRYILDPTGTLPLVGRISVSGSVAWYLTDNLGSVRSLVGGTGTVLDQLTYDAYGNVVSETAPSSGDRFKYAGGEYDGVTGLYQFGARYYSPSDGRFISQDPLSFQAGDADLYRYTFNQPTDATDPSGEFIFAATVAAAIGVTAMIAGASAVKYASYSRQNPNGPGACTTVAADWWDAGGRTLFYAGAATAAAPWLVAAGAACPVAGAVLGGAGVGMTAADFYKIYKTDKTNWTGPDYLRAYGPPVASLIAGALSAKFTGAFQWGASFRPNSGAARLLGDPAFQRRAMSGVECAETADALQTAAGGKTGGILSLSPPEGAPTVKHPTRLGPADSVHHQVYTNGNFVYDPVYSDKPIPRADYEALIRQLNGPTVDISFFPADK